MPSSRRRVRGVLLLLVAALCVVVSANAAPSKPSPDVLWHRAVSLFHAVEPEFNNYYNPITELAPLSPADAGYQGYERAAEAAEAYLAAFPKANSYRTSIALFFAAMSYSRIQSHEKALQYINRLQSEFPNSKRARVPNAPQFDRDITSDLLRLKLWHESQFKTPLQNQKPLDILQAVARDGATAIASRPKSAPAGIDFSSPTEAQLRVAALPDVPTLAAQIHNELLPSAIKTNGAKAVRDYLRSLSGGNGPFAAYASGKLLDIDRIILASYREEANKALREHRYAAAKAVYQRIMQEYSGTDTAKQAEADLKRATIGEFKYVAELALKEKRFDDARKAYRGLISFDPDEAQWAQGELKKIVPVAVAYFKQEGDKNFQPVNKIGVPQSKAREFYQKMYEEDPTGPLADEALLGWSRALGTEGKVDESAKHLQELLDKFPGSEQRPSALYALGFLNGGQKLRQYDKAVKLLDEVAAQYPKSREASEALWHGAFFLAWNNQFAPALERLQKLNAQYPDSPRHKWTAQWIARFEKKIKNGGQWP